MTSSGTIQVRVGYSRIAILLFTWARTDRPALKVAFMATLVAVFAALILTFSRSAYTGVAVIVDELTRLAVAGAGVQFTWSWSPTWLAVTLVG